MAFYPLEDWQAASDEWAFSLLLGMPGGACKQGLISEDSGNKNPIYRFLVEFSRHLHAPKPVLAKMQGGIVALQVIGYQSDHKQRPFINHVGNLGSSCGVEYVQDDFHDRKITSWTVEIEYKGPVGSQWPTLGPHHTQSCTKVG
jgi:hypothetical protein